ncbi:hypothetical protein KP509_14G008800 [Ceratopteris richardii]|uniref:Uncharacterized protein n=1 Tax=Ceratopteris richardii TaxID=49495 RepID=A0A8T2T7E3_CERRI|nr:hypothetical protein KP509_14G008800 [Ceratopteris richardii]
MSAARVAESVRLRWKYGFSGVESHRALSTRGRRSHRDLDSENSLEDTPSRRTPSSSFEYTGNADKKTLNGTLGTDLSGLQKTASQRVKSQSPSEVEGSFYSTLDQDSRLELKTYTDQEELGEKLRRVHPPKEQIVSSATGFSFGERRAGLERIEEEQSKVGQNDEYMVLKEGLSKLNPFLTRKS